MKKWIVLVGLLATVAPMGAAASAPPGDPFFGVHYRRQVVGTSVAIEMAAGQDPVTMGKTWELSGLDGQGTAFYQWPDDQLELGTDDTRMWVWDQRVNACYGECVNVREGDPAPAGRYEVVTTMDGEEVRTEFVLGQYFTVGFTSRPNIEYVVYVATPEEVDQMTVEAAAEDKSLIVSGIVQKKRAYNDFWNFSMGPRSIELGEVFIEVCDGSPWYVQKHRDEWLGERWCPWSSYVKRVGT